MHVFGRNIWRLCLAVGLVFAVIIGLLTVHVSGYRKRAEQLIVEGKWDEARQTLGIYLRCWPNDPEAQLLMARALVSDNKLRGDDQIQTALNHLQQIRPTSPRAAEARLQEGRLRFLLLLQPGRAEQCFKLSLEHEPDRSEVHSLLWTLFDMTSRWDLSEEHFWYLYAQASPAERVLRLRDWYLSEFSPGTTTVGLDRRWGFLGETEQPTIESDRRRFEAFLAAEPDWPTGYAILARWFQRQGALQQASELLDQAERNSTAHEDAFFLATRISVSIELGEFDRARIALEKWPPPLQGYEYWKSNGLVADQVLRDNGLARHALERAIATTAGKSDWLIQFRLAQCLTRLGELKEAAAMRSYSKDVESLMETAVHVELRRALLVPTAPKTVELMVDLYHRMGRYRERDAWQQLTATPRPATLPHSTGHRGGTGIPVQATAPATDDTVGDENVP